MVAILSKISLGAVISEGKNPGDKELTRIGIPFSAKSSANTFVKCAREDFEAAYANCGARAVW